MRVEENEELVRKVITLLTFGSKMKTGKYEVTELVQCPKKTYFGRKGISGVITEETVLAYTRGKAHHVVLEVFPFKEIVREKDGIIGRIDMIEDRPIEIFTTLMSARKEPVKAYPLKIRQLMAYCHMDDRLEGDLLVFHLMGDYTRPIKPKLRAHTLRFEQDELEYNWREVLANRQEVENCLQLGIEPLLTGEEFECRNCGYRHICYEDIIEEAMEDEYR